jgi:hypothetical protein
VGLPGGPEEVPDVVDPGRSLAGVREEDLRRCRAEPGIGVEGGGERSQPPGLDEGVGVHQRDGIDVGQVVQPAVHSAGVAEVRAGIDERDIGMPLAPAVDGAVRGSVVHHHDVESSWPVGGEDVLEAAIDQGDVVPAEDDSANAFDHYR